MIALLLAVWLAWDPVTAVPVQGYRIYYGPTSGQQTISQDVGNQTTGEVRNIPAGSTTYFVVRAYNAVGESGPSNEVLWVEPTPTSTPTPTPTPTPSPTPSPTPNAVTYQINSGGGAASPYTADAYYVGGGTYYLNPVIDTTGVTDPAPQAVYWTERNGNFTYTFPGLKPAGSYKVRLHFAELYWGQAGSRLFDVAINGQTVLSSFDIFAAAGGNRRAVVREFGAQANVSGQIVVKYTTVKDNAKSSGIEILERAPVPSPTPLPSPTPTPAQQTKSTLTVINGSGGGTYDVGQTIAVKARKAPRGKTFNMWIGDKEILNNFLNARTTATIPSTNVSIEATYKDK
jgi:hypothetical protein